MASIRMFVLLIVQLTIHVVVDAKCHDHDAFETEINAKYKSLAAKCEDSMKYVREIKATNKAILQENSRLRNFVEKYITKAAAGNNSKQLNGEKNQFGGQMSSRALDYGNNVAFSAYLDHNVDNLGAGQTIVFNQVLLNDGNAYNQHSGIFTTPMAGVYSFSFFIGQRGTHQTWIQLYVNSENKIDADVDTWHAGQDLQGGNMVNLKLAQNDIVYIRNQDGNAHMEGTDGHRVTSFSGFLIYPIENQAVVG